MLTWGVLEEYIVGSNNVLQSRGESRTTLALARLIEALEGAFPGRMRGYDVHGSVADGEVRVALKDVLP